MKNQYKTLRSNASLSTIAKAAEKDASQKWETLQAFSQTLKTGSLLSYEDSYKLKQLTYDHDSASDLSAHLCRCIKSI